MDRGIGNTVVLERDRDPAARTIPMDSSHERVAPRVLPLSFIVGYPSSFVPGFVGIGVYRLVGSGRVRRELKLIALRPAIRYDVSAVSLYDYWFER